MVKPRDSPLYTKGEEHETGPGGDSSLGIEANAGVSRSGGGSDYTS